MQEVANAILEILYQRYPEVFETVVADVEAGRRAAR
jgi:hypothetical protein